MKKARKIKFKALKITILVKKIQLNFNRQQNESAANLMKRIKTRARITINDSISSNIENLMKVMKKMIMYVENLVNCVSMTTTF